MTDNNLKFIYRAGLFFWLWIVLPASLYGQIDGDSDWSSATAYGEDTLLVFYSDNPQKSLSVSYDQGSGYDFLWQRFNKSTMQFDSLFIQRDRSLSEVGLDSLYEKGLLEDAVEGLQVSVLDSQSIEQAYRAWVITDTLPGISLSRYINTCDQIKLLVENLDLKDYTYYDLASLPGDTNQITLENELTRFQWEASAGVEIYWDDTPLYEGERVIGYIGSPFQMPYEDSDYSLEVGNFFNNTVSATIEDVKAKAVKADFILNKITHQGALEDYDPGKINEAPLQILPENKSQNASVYHWVGLNDSLNILRGRDSILWEARVETPVESDIPPYRPGRYPVRLKVSNEYECKDSTTYYHVRVDSSQIDSSMIPNVFTPDGNGINDVFVLPKATNLSGSGRRGLVSMKWIEVSVFNRSGELVYRYNGDPMEWEGWRGKVRNSNRDAAEGVYLYVIKGRGYDGVMHEHKQYSGFLYLFRQQ